MREMNISIKVLKEGQPRPYADSEYEYEIESKGLGEYDIKSFCTKILKPCHQTIKEWDKDSAGSYFGGYYEFYNVGEYKYRYYVKKPYTG